MINDFENSLDEELKQRYFKNMVKAKIYGGENYIDYIPDSIAEGILRSIYQLYQHIFGPRDVELFQLNYRGDYTIADQYCMNPECLCNDVHLTFYNMNEKNKSDFSVVYKIDEKTYSIVEPRKADVDVHTVMKYFISNKPETLKAISRRYQEMKKAGRKILEKYRQNHSDSKGICHQVSDKPGRNDPCPCGSGRKYKKCCGR